MKKFTITKADGSQWVINADKMELRERAVVFSKKGEYGSLSETGLVSLAHVIAVFESEPPSPDPEKKP